MTKWEMKDKTITNVFNIERLIAHCKYIEKLAFIHSRIAELGVNEMGPLQ